MVARRLFCRVMPDKIDDERILRAEDSVRVEICIALDEQVRCDRHKTIC